MSMTPDQVITKAFLHAQRKATAPTAGTAKYNALLAIVDSMQKMWANEPNIDWDSLYTLRTLTATATATTTIALDSDIDYILKREDDPILIGTTIFKVVKPNQLYKYRNTAVCAQVGSNLKFSHTIDTNLVGSAIQVPCIINVPDITTGGSTTQVVVDDPMWLAYMSAAEFDRNDIVRVAQYNNILAMADQSMQKMKRNNSGALEEIETPWQPEGISWT